MSKPKKNIKMMQGNRACAEAAIVAGCKFFAGYPITPSTEIAEVLSMKLPAVGGNFIQMEDEIGAMGAIVGASLGGAKSMTATSGPGFSLKQENLGFAVMAEIPCVVVDVQRGGPSTGLPTHASQGDVMQARFGTHGDHPIIALSPTSVKETYDMTIRAFNLAEKYRTPVILLTDELVGHLTERLEIPDPGTVEVIDRIKPTDAPDQYLPYKNTESMVPPMANFGEGYRYHVTGLVHDETGFPTNDSDKADEMLARLNEKIEKNKADIIDVEKIKMDDDIDTLIIAYGSSARSARRAVETSRKEGKKVGLLILKTIWPFPEKEIVEAANNVNRIIVPELNLGQIAHEVEWAIGRRIPVEKINLINGESIKPSEIHKLIMQG